MCIVPQPLYDDERIPSILHQFMDRIGSQKIPVSVQPLPSGSIQAGHQVIIPCIAASRVGSDLKAAVAKANLQGEYSVTLNNCPLNNQEHGNN